MRGEQAGVLGTSLADSERSDGHTGRHLDDGEETVLTLQRLAFNRYAEHGQRRHRRCHAGQMGGAAGPRDDNFEACRLGTLGVGVEPVRGAMG